MGYSMAELKDWAYGGVDPSLPGNGGEACAQFLSLRQRLLETVLCIVVTASMMLWGYRRITVPEKFQYVRKDRGGKRILLVVVSLIWGMEIGFKFATKTVIYLHNPCHVVTAIQIYLLAAPPSKLVTKVFRVHFNFLSGAVLALVLPVTNTRLLPFEVEVYWIQHIMVLVVPYYLLRLGGVYTVESVCDWSWTVLTTGFIIAYHFVILQVISLKTQVNLNNMLCPAISDPFYGPYYRLFALCHQSLVIPLVCKGYCAISSFFLTKCRYTRVKSNLSADVTLSSFEERLEETMDSVKKLSKTSESCGDCGGHRRSYSEVQPKTNGWHASKED